MNDATHAVRPIPGPSPTDHGGRTPPAHPPGRVQLKASIRGRDLAEQDAILSPTSAAAQGVAGAGAALPFADRIQASFGRYDVSGVRAAVGGPAREASAALGARAYALGDRVGFGEQPDLHTVAHEAAHTVQQRAGVHLAAETGQPGDRHERHADAVADRVVRGESAEDLLAEYGPPGREAAPSNAVQCYYNAQLDSGAIGRLSENGHLVTHSAKALFATPELIERANAALSSVGRDGSHIGLRPSRGTRAPTTARVLHGAALPGAHPVAPDIYRVILRGLIPVEPVWQPKGGSNGTKKLDEVNAGKAPTSEGGMAKGLALWSDCGRAAGTVMGANAANLGDRAALIKAPGGGQGVVGEGVPHNAFAMLVRNELFRFVRRHVDHPDLVEGLHFSARAGARAALPPSSFDYFTRLPGELRDAFEQETGTGHAANPEIGQAYSVMRLSGHGFNYHWGGVIMKDGGDNVTLENFAVTPDYAESKGENYVDFVNERWLFQMYGTQTKEQSFDAQYRESGAVGDDTATLTFGDRYSLANRISKR